MHIVLEVLKRADHLVGCRLDALENVDLAVCKNHCLMTVIHIDHREDVDVLTDALKVVSCTLLQRSRDAECCDHTCDCRVDT